MVDNKKLRAKMMMADVSQKKLAEEIGIDYATLSQKINGKRQFTIAEAEKIFKVLGMSAEEGISIFFSHTVA